MTCLLNLFPQSLAVIAAAVNPSDLSEGELLARYPAVAIVAIVLLSLGLVCDLYLLFRVTRSSRSGPPTADASWPRIEPKPWGLDDLLIAIGALALAWLIVDGLTFGVIKLAHAQPDDETALPWVLSIEMLLRIGMLFGFVRFFRHRHIDWGEAVGLRRKPPLRAIAVGGVFFLAVLPPVAAVFVVYAKFCSLVGIEDTPQPIADLMATSDSAIVVGLIAVFAVIVAPVFEEFFFRGFAYPALKQRWGIWPSLLLVSAAFALIHLHLPSFGPLFALAVGFGLAYEFTGSLLAPITMHALFNAANVAMLVYIRSRS